MKKVLSFLLVMVMTATVMLLVVPPIEVSAASMTVTELKEQVTYSYTQAKKLSGKSNFSGLCGTMVGYQLKALGINPSLWAVDGKDHYDHYITMKKTSSGYKIALYPASSGSIEQILNTITQNGTKDAYNLLVGFQKGYGDAGAKHGHVMFVNGIIDGTVYFCESGSVTIGGKRYNEGSVISCSISTFANYYKNVCVQFEGIVHFYTCTEFEGLGICKDCGQAFNWEKTLDKKVAGTYTVVNNFTPRTNAPYNDATKASTTIKKGETVEVIGVYTNAYENKWYKFTYNNGKSVGYVLNTYLSFSSHTHSFGSTYSSNASGHWKTCSTCDGKGTVSTHSYSNNCDTSCNTCGYKRSITHTYTDDSDATCNTCGYTRTVNHDYVHIKDDSYDTNFKAFPYAKITNDNLFDADHNKMNANNWIAATDECTILEVYTDGCCKVTYPLDSGGTRTLYSKISLFNIVYDCDHSYTYKSNSSGHWKECVQCGEKQTTSSHTYTNNCDTSCNTCGYTRTTTHSYTNSCDKSCNVCGATRTITHTYNSTYSYDSVHHWKNCTVCGNYGTFEDHSYTNNCDTNCNICGYTRTTEHSYDNDCDATCNVCGDTRNTEHNYDAYDYDFDHHWKVCSVCGYADEATEAHSISSVYYLKDIFYVTYHFTDCTVCGGELGYRHKYTNDCDASCNDCEYTRNTKHSYDHDCDTDCNICGETRSTQHIYDNENDTTCNICGEVRTVETLPSSTPEDTEPITEPNTTPDTNNTPSNSNKNDNNNDDKDSNNTTIIIVAVAGAVTVSTVSILGTAFIMKKKR